MQYTISVTEDDISHGKISDCEACPVALAMQRGLGRMVYIHVYTYDFVPRSRTYRLTERALPVRVAENIVTFDRLVIMEPFDFTVDVEL